MEQSYNKQIRYFAVIDTETTWSNEVMSIGIVIADSESFELVERKYYIITPECEYGGMYSYVMNMKDIKIDLKESRSIVIKNLIKTLQSFNVKNIFAYNASFDYKHLSELQEYMWFDIMKLAAYKQFNKKIPESAECCGTGRLKRDYGVEPIMRMLTGRRSYCEVHNAVCDAEDELRIMKLLGYSIENYECTQINAPKKDKVSKIRQSRSKQVSVHNVKEEQKECMENCKYKVGDKIKHKLYGVGIIIKAEKINEDIFLLTVRYESISIRLHMLPDDEEYIQLLI